MRLDPAMRLERLLLAVLICRHATVAMAAAKTTLVIAPSTQSGGFLHGHDVGPMNPHSYRPNEFFANDFIFEGLVAPDPDSSGGVASSLASDWSIQTMDKGKMKITFKLRKGVKFHVCPLTSLLRPCTHVCTLMHADRR